MEVRSSYCSDLPETEVFLLEPLIWAKPDTNYMVPINVCLLAIKTSTHIKSVILLIITNLILVKKSSLVILYECHSLMV